MKMFSWKTFGIAAMTLLVAGMLLGCEEKGPAQRAGENIDNAGKDLKNSLDPRGPGEKAGEKVDKALGK
jgi:hypothetical protein